MLYLLVFNQNFNYYDVELLIMVNLGVLWIWGIVLNSINYNFINYFVYYDLFKYDI